MKISSNIGYNNTASLNDAFLCELSIFLHQSSSLYV